MKKTKLSAVLTVVMLAVALSVASFAFTACGATVESITLNTNGVTTTFEVGDTFSSSGLKVTAKMSDGTEADVALKDCKISNPNMTVAGEKEITVTYQEKKATYKITVKERNETPPLPWTADFEVDPATKTVYELSAVQASLQGSDRLGPSDVDPTHSVGGMIYGDKVIFMIKSESAGKAKMSIDFDDTFHAGLYVNRLIKFTVGNKVIETDASFESTDKAHQHTPGYVCYQRTLIGEIDLVAGENTITLEFIDNGANLKSLILDFSDGTTPPAPVKTLTGITADATEAKTTYYRESRFLSDGVSVTATYSDNSTVAVDLDDCTVTPPDMTTAGSKTAKIAYEGKETTYNVTVNDYYQVKVTDTVKQFSLNAVDAVLSDAIKIERAKNSIGGIAKGTNPDETYTEIYKFNAAAAGTAKLIYVCDCTFQGAPVKNHLDLTVNETTKDLNGVNFVANEAGHVHTEAWYCFKETELCEIAVKEGPNTVKFEHKSDFTNVRGIKLDFDLTEDPAPVAKSYTFEAEDALLSNCMVEYKTGVSAGGDMLVGGWTDKAGPSSATFEVYAEDATTADLTLKFDGGGNAGKLGTIFTVSVEGVALEVDNIDFNAGSGATWYAWTAAKIPDVSLKAGLNTIVVGKVGGSNFDSISFSSVVKLTEVQEGAKLYSFDGSKTNAKSEDVVAIEGHSGWLKGAKADSTITYKIHSDVEATAMLSVLFDRGGSKPDVSDIMSVTVGTDTYDTTARLAYCNGSPDPGYFAIPCKLGKVNLGVGDTTITFTFKGEAPNFKGISLLSTQSLTAVTA